MPNRKHDNGKGAHRLQRGFVDAPKCHLLSPVVRQGSSGAAGQRGAHCVGVEESVGDSARAACHARRGEARGGRDEPHEGDPRATPWQRPKLPVDLHVVDPEYFNTLWAVLGSSK